MDCFFEDAITQARVVIACHSRIQDLHNFDYIMKRLSYEAQQEIILRLGWLNVINPLKPSFDYCISLVNLDSRILLVTLLEMSAADNGDNIKDDTRTDIPLVTLFGSMSRIINDSRTEVLKFSYCEVRLHVITRMVVYSMYVWIVIIVIVIMKGFNFLIFGGSKRLFLSVTKLTKLPPHFSPLCRWVSEPRP